MRQKTKRLKKEAIPEFQPEDIFYVLLLGTGDNGILGIKRKPEENEPGALLAWTTEERALEYKKDGGDHGGDLSDYSVRKISYIYLILGAMKLSVNIEIDTGIGDWVLLVKIDQLLEEKEKLTHKGVLTEGD